MKKDCSQIQKEMLACNGAFTAVIEEHCADCESCLQIKQDWKLFADLKPTPEIPLSNDFAIIRAAQKYSRSQRIQVAIRRGFGYAAATVSGIAAVYAVMFHGPMTNTSNDVFHKAWSWDSFEERVFVLDTAAEVSRQDITIGDDSKDEALNNFIETEINFEQL
jgi:hypothetical protein